MPAATIQRRSSADIPELARVLARVYSKDRYPVEGVGQAQEWISPAGELTAWTALVNGVPVGHISLTQAEPSGDVASLWARHTGRPIEQLAVPVRLFVDPAYRESGIGGQLISAVGEYAANHRLAVAFDVMLKDHDAIRLYEKLGCSRIGVVIHEHSGGKREPAAVYVAPEVS